MIKVPRFFKKFDRGINVKIIFFDGVCGLCNGFVTFIMKVDKKRKFYFSPLQGEFANEHLPKHFISDLKSVVLMSDGKISSKSDAVIRILVEIGGIWKVALICRILPVFLLDFFYNLIAENRYRLFGKKSSCRIPSPEERSRFVI